MKIDIIVVDYKAGLESEYDLLEREIFDIVLSGK
jgi:hypothetical protein